MICAVDPKIFSKELFCFPGVGSFMANILVTLLCEKIPICTSAEMFWNLNNCSIIFNSIHNLWKVLYRRQHCLNGEYQLVLPVYYLVIVSSNINIVWDETVSEDSRSCLATSLINNCSLWCNDTLLSIVLWQTKSPPLTPEEPPGIWGKLSWYLLMCYAALNKPLIGFKGSKSRQID